MSCATQILGNLDVTVVYILIHTFRIKTNLESRVSRSELVRWSLVLWDISEFLRPTLDRCHLISHHNNLPGREIWPITILYTRSYFTIEILQPNSSPRWKMYRGLCGEKWSRRGILFSKAQFKYWGRVMYDQRQTTALGKDLDWVVMMSCLWIWILTSPTVCGVHWPWRALVHVHRACHGSEES